MLRTWTSEGEVDGDVTDWIAEVDGDVPAWTSEVEGEVNVVVDGVFLLSAVMVISFLFVISSMSLTVFLTVEFPDEEQAFALLKNCLISFDCIFPSLTYKTK